MLSFSGRQGVVPSVLLLLVLVGVVVHRTASPPSRTSEQAAAAAAGVAAETTSAWQKIFSLPSVEFEQEVDIPLRKVPDAVIGSLSAHLPGATLVKAEKEWTDGVITYELTVQREDGEEVEVEMTTRGDLL